MIYFVAFGNLALKGNILCDFAKAGASCLLAYFRAKVWQLVKNTFRIIFESEICTPHFYIFGMFYNAFEVDTIWSTHKIQGFHSYLVSMPELFHQQKKYNFLYYPHSNLEQQLSIESNEHVARHALEIQYVWHNNSFYLMVHFILPNGPSTTICLKTFLLNIDNVLQLKLDYCWTAWIYHYLVFSQYLRLISYIY